MKLHLTMSTKISVMKRAGRREGEAHRRRSQTLRLDLKGAIPTIFLNKKRIRL